METDHAARQSVRLLLLPSPPSEASLITFKAAYEPTLDRVIGHIQSMQSGGFVLDIALLCGNASLGELNSKAKLYDILQRQMSMLYRVIVYVFAQKNVDPRDGDSVDFRVLLVHESSQTGEPETAEASSQGPFIPLITLARSERRWTEVYAVESEPGERLVQAFVRHRHNFQPHGRLAPFEIYRVMGGITLKSSANQIHAGAPTQNHGKHFSCAVGGTFDHLHVGHKVLLTAAALVLESNTNPKSPIPRVLIIGITGDDLLKNKKYADLLETWDKRQIAVVKFLAAILDLSTPVESVPSEYVETAHPKGRAVSYYLPGNIVVYCVEISDPFGPTITEESISALVVSAETRSGGKAINDRRSEKGWPPLEVFEVDVLDADFNDEEIAAERDDFQSKISSTEIRKRLHENGARPS